MLTLAISGATGLWNLGDDMALALSPDLQKCIGRGYMLTCNEGLYFALSFAAYVMQTDFCSINITGD